MKEAMEDMIETVNVPTYFLTQISSKVPAFGINADTKAKEDIRWTFAV